MFGNEGKKTIDLDVIARNIFGADAERFKQMAQNMNQQQINEIMAKFQSLPQDKKQQFLSEIQGEIAKVGNSAPGHTGVGIGVVKGRW
ncbi:MAG: hypothetical protein ACRCX2_36590 [Paraclostridium sp.]